MHRKHVFGAVAAAALFASASLWAQNGTPINPNSKNVLTLAVFGDSPYGTSSTDTAQTEKTPAFIDSINRDPKVDLVLHVGDIHSGSQFCTESYDRTIADLWTGFKNPLIYTPGDNEWTDCHKKKQGGHLGVDYADGDPLANLDLVRDIFFANPGYALGGRHKRVLTQAQNYEPAHPEDGEYVENVMGAVAGALRRRQRSRGSNNDTDAGSTTARLRKPRPKRRPERRKKRVDGRRSALPDAVRQARRDGARRSSSCSRRTWDPEKGSAHIANYRVYRRIAAHTLAFARPVLLFNGDSHVYRTDNPLRVGATCQIENGASTKACANDPAASQVPNYVFPDTYPNVPNFHRVVVHGSTFPMEWLRLTVTPGANASGGPTAFGPFTWQRVQPSLP
jgi:hypothetical protein